MTGIGDLTAVQLRDALAGWDLGAVETALFFLARIDFWTAAPPSSVSRVMRRVLSSACLARPATDWIIETSRSSRGERGDKIEGRRWASMDFPAPGGPLNRSARPGGSAGQDRVQRGSHEQGRCAGNGRPEHRRRAPPRVRDDTGQSDDPATRDVDLDRPRFDGEIDPPQHRAGPSRRARSRTERRWLGCVTAVCPSGWPIVQSSET